MHHPRSKKKDSVHFAAFVNSYDLLSSILFAFWIMDITFTLHKIGFINVFCTIHLE